MRILITPERLSELAGQFQQISAGLMDVGNRCQGALASLDWEARQRASVEEEVDRALRMATALAQRALEQSAFLESAASRFEEADRNGVVAVAAVTAGAAAALARVWGGLPSWMQVRLGGFADWERVSALLGAPLGGLTSLQPGGGTGLAGLSFLASLPWVGKPLYSLAESVWNWLHGYGWRENREFISPVPTDEPSIPKGQLANLIRKGFAEKAASPSASRQAAPAQSGDTVHEQTPPLTAAPFGHSVPLISQQGLKYGDQKTQYGCTAASTAMVLAYWHSRNPDLGRLSAQEILDANIKQGKFTGTGLSVSEVHDEVQDLGYSVVEDRINSDFDTLKRDVEQGPVIAIVKLGMQKSGYNHAVVVTGISDDGRVAVNDPWDGQQHEYPVEIFLASWGADFGGPDAPRNNYMVIRP